MAKVDPRFAHNDSSLFEQLVFFLSPFHSHHFRPSQKLVTSLEFCQYTIFSNWTGNQTVTQPLRVENSIRSGLIEVTGWNMFILIIGEY